MYERDYTQWTEEDKNYVFDMWGQISPHTIAKHLQRKPSAIMRFAEKNKLNSKDTGYLIPSQVGRMLNKEAETIRYWILHSGLKATKKNYLRRNSYLLEPQDIRDFLVANPEKWKATKMEGNPFGINETWLANKRLEESKTPKAKELWSYADEQLLLKYIDEGKTNREICELMGRTFLSIRRKRTNIMRSRFYEECNID